MIKNSIKDIKKIKKHGLFAKNYKSVTDVIVGFIRNHFDNCPRKKVIFGLSGGLDSAVCAALYCRALGPENVYVVMMPAPNSSENSRDDAYSQAKKLGIPDGNIYYRPLQKLLRAFGFNEEELKKGGLAIGNVSARLRMVTLFKIADQVGSIVSGTENKTEHLLGYFTIGGDAVSMVEPIHHLFKWEVKKLAEHLGVIPEIRDKKPSAELWDGQTDEGELGFSYHDADIALACHGLGKNPGDYGVGNESAAKVLKRMQYSEFKRRIPAHM